MDKYEYQVCADQIKNYIAEKKYAEAMEIADKIDWRRVKSVSMLCTVSEIYKVNKRYEESRDILLLAYDRYPKGRMIVYALCELALKMNDVVQAVEYYKEFVRVAPGDTGSYILLYKIYEAQDVSIDERIKVLEEFKKRDYRERWAYELAYLYHKTGQETKCVNECDELILWFGEGKYVKKAMDLKMQHAHLSGDQKQKYNDSAKTAGGYQGSYYQQNGAYSNPAVQEGQLNPPYPSGQQAGYGIPEGGYDPGRGQGDYSGDQGIYGGYGQAPYAPAQNGMDSTPLVAYNSDRFSTQNLQAELRQNMEEYLNPAHRTGELDIINTGRINTGKVQTGQLRTGELDLIDTGRINTGKLHTGELDLIDTGRLNVRQTRTGELDVIDTGRINTGELPYKEPYDEPGMTVSQIENGVPEKTQEFVFNPNAMQQFVQTYIAPQAPGEDPDAVESPEENGTELHPGEPVPYGQEAPAMSFGAMAGVLAEETRAYADAEDSEEEIITEAEEIAMEAPASQDINTEASEPELQVQDETFAQAGEAEETGGYETGNGGETVTEAEKAEEEGIEETAAEEAGEAEAENVTEVSETEEASRTETASEAVGEEAKNRTEAVPEAENGEAGERKEAGPEASQSGENKEDDTKVYVREWKSSKKYDELLGQEYSGQIYLSVPDVDMVEKQITGQIDIEEVLRHYRKRIENTGEMGSGLSGLAAGWGSAEPEFGAEDELVSLPAEPLSVDVSAIEKILKEEEEEEKAEAVEEIEEEAGIPEEAAESETEEEPGTEGEIEKEPGAEETEAAEAEEELRAEETEEAEAEEESGAEETEEAEAEEEPGAEETEEAEAEEESGAEYTEEAGVLEEEAGEEAETEEGPGYFGAEESEEYTASEEETREEENGEETAAEEEAEASGAYMQSAFSYELEDYGEVEEIEDITQPDEVDEIIKTSNLPIEEIAEYNALAEQALNAERESEQLPPNYDEYGRMKHPSYMVLEEARKSRRDFDEYEYKLFGRYDGIENVKAQLVDVIDSMSMQADVGNIILTGEEVSCRKTMAIDLIKAMQSMDSSFMGKVAKISGEALNKKNIPSTLRKLNNGALIVENAGGLSAAALTIIAQSLSKDVESILILLEGDAEPIERLLETNPQMFDSVFSSRISIDEFTNDDLVAYARGYAREREHSIDEMGTLALYTRIGELQTLDHKVTVEDIKDLIDLAIIHVDKMTIGHLIDVLVSKRYDDDDNIIIREKDFLLDEKKQEKLKKKQKKQKMKKNKAEG